MPLEIAEGIRQGGIVTTTLADNITRTLARWAEARL
jgi:hypothetical protein